MAESNGTQEVLLLTAQQAADLCQVSVDRIYEWTYIPGFPVIAGPHQLRIHARLFEEWLVARAAEGRTREDAEQPRTEETAA